MLSVLDFIVARIKEPSTWEGATVLATLVGVAISPEQTEAMVTFGGSLYGLIKVFKKEPKPPVTVTRG